MENEKRNYNLNLDFLVLFFLIDKEELDKRAWFKGKKEKYEKELKECYDFLSIVIRGEEELIKWENENWTCNLSGKKISFVLEKKSEKNKNSNWKEVKFIEKIAFANWNTNGDLFEFQIKKSLETCFEEKIIFLSENKVKFRIRFYREDEQGKPDMSITFINNEKEENNIALEITQADTSPFLINGGSLHDYLDDKIEKRDLKEARRMINILEDTNIELYLPNLFKNMKDALIKKNKKSYDCGKTIVWVILIGYCYMGIQNLLTREETSLTHKNRENDEKFFSHFLLENIKKMSEEFKTNRQKIRFDHLLVRFSEATQKKESWSNGKFYKFNPFTKNFLHIPIIDGEIRVEEQLEEIEKKYKNEIKDLKISPIRYAIHPWNEKDDDEE